MSRRASPKRKLVESAAVFSALGDETRLRLVGRMCDLGPSSIANLTEGSGVTRQAVAKHLRVLEDVGLVKATRSGRESSWQLLDGGLEEARRNLEQIAKQWDSTLGRLQKFLEKEERE